jgi:hypothetical protein
MSIEALKPLLVNTAVALLAACFSCFSVFAQDPKAAIQKDLEARYPLTQPTADNTEIVTAGAVLQLLTNSIAMVSATSSSNPYQNVFKDGKITAGKLSIFMKNMPGVSSRTFVKGEKMWVTRISVKDDGIHFDLFTDAFGDTRFKGSLKVPFPKDWTPTPDQAEKVVAEVFSLPGAVEETKPTPSTPVRVKAQAAAQPAAPITREAAPPPIAPPPPPPDQPAPAPPTISLKQTKEQVEATFGKPNKIVDLGRKQIYIYKDMKVTFIDGKVSNIE